MEPELPDLLDSRTPWQHRLVGTVLYVLAIFFTYRLFSAFVQGADLHKAMLPALGATAMPLFAIALSATAPQFYSLGPRAAGSSQFQVGWVVLIPGLVLCATLVGQFHLVLWWPLFLVALVGGFILAWLISRLLYGIENFVYIMGYCSAYVGGAVLFINCMFDYKPVEVATQRYADVRSSTFTVNLKHARPYGLTQLQLNTFDFNDSSGICVRVYRGALFLGWYTVDPYLDCPDANPRRDDVMHRQAQLCSAGSKHACLALAKFKAGKYTPDELGMEWALMACLNGDRQQCQVLCAAGKKYLVCANQEWRIDGRDWTFRHMTQGYDPDGRYRAHVTVTCTVPLAAPAQPSSKPVQHSVQYDGEQFRGPVSKRMYMTMGEAMSEVCAPSPAPAPRLKVPPYDVDRPLEERGTSTQTSLRKCQGADGKIILTDMACPKGRE